MLLNKNMHFLSEHLRAEHAEQLEINSNYAITIYNSTIF